MNHGTKLDAGSGKLEAASGKRAIPSVRARLESIDVLRGVVMIIMALDHTRDYLRRAGRRSDQSRDHDDRAVLHALDHALLRAGVLPADRDRRPAVAGSKGAHRRLSRYLLTRGLWLVFLEPIVVRCLVYQFNFDFHVTLLLVLWALGWSMVRSRGCCGCRPGRSRHSASS